MMKSRMKRRLCAAVALKAVCLAMSAPASAVTTPIFSDNFESYADTTALRAPSAWGNFTTITLQTTGGNPAQNLVYVPTGSGTGLGVAGKHSVSAITPTNANPIIWTFDFFDDGVGNKRATGGLRNAGGSAILEMGRYNNANNGATAASGYAVRTALIGGPVATPGDSGWFTFIGNPSVQTGWHRFNATVFADFVVFELDLGANGSVNATQVLNTTTGGSEIYNQLRLGGPSDVGSAGGGARYDNVFLGQGLAAPTLGLFNTGVNNGGAVLHGNGIDPHYSVHRGVASANAPVNLGVGGAAFVTPTDGFPIPPWIANSATSAWISSQPGDGNDAAGFYDYNLTFNLAAHTALIEGQWAADNSGVNIFVNGNPTGLTNPGFGSLTNFTLSPLSGFATGINVLTFRVQNAGTAANPTGLRVQITNFVAINIPEPATLSLSALAVLALGRRRNRTV